MAKKRKIFQIFNLEFPPYIEELKIGDYVFGRVENYPEAFDGMMCLVNSFGSEFSTQRKTGSHQITAKVEIPAKEKKSVLPWGEKRLTELDDILFLLTIFTGRNVFKKDWDDDKDIAIIQDHRLHHYGGQLHLSLSDSWVFKNISTGEIRLQAGLGSTQLFHWQKVNIGFEESLNQVLKTLSSTEWREEYEGGYFLFLFRSAVQRQIIETSFVSCWTIWEHIFSIKNRNWLDEESIRKIGADNRISFILSQFFLKSIDNTARTNIRRIVKTRNRLVHFGKKTDQVDVKEMNMFIRLTEQLLAIVLGLSPSNAFNSFEALDKFLIKT
ncbi:MAG: HEPN domain-containing protein [Patescibacteria group bacterium]